MNRRLSLFLLFALALVVLWGGISWSFSQSSQRAFTQYVSTLSEQNFQHFFEVEVDEYQETFLGAEARLSVRFSIPSFRETLGELKLKATRLNGPVFINQSGVQFGSARWLIVIDQRADEVLSNTLKSLFVQELPEAIVRFDFFDQAHFQFVAEHIRSDSLDIDGLSLDGSFDLSSGAYDLEASAAHSNVSFNGLSLNTPAPEIAIQRLAQKLGLDARSNAAVIDLNAHESVLSYGKQGKKNLLDISSRGSLWLINDTLSGDWQMLVKDVPELSSKKLHLNLQFREWLAEGFFAYWRQLSQIANLYEQAEWALEEGAETPEEQDFIMALYSDAEHIKQSQSRDILKPMLRYQRSELSVSAQLSDGDEVQGQLIASAITDGSELNPQLNMSGEVAIQTRQLNEATVSLFDKWSQRFWLRRYETAFESDLSFRDKQFLLNNIQVSLTELSSELKQSINDQ